MNVLIPLFMTFVFTQHLISREQVMGDLRAAFEDERPVLIYVIVALCDNEHQGIVPVSKTLGNGNDPQHNLYWGAGYGVKTFLRKSTGWQLVTSSVDLDTNVPERYVFKRKDRDVYLSRPPQPDHQCPGISKNTPHQRL